MSEIERNRTLALGVMAGPVVMTLAWVVLGFLSPGYTMWGTRIAHYSALSQPVSGLGLGPTGPYMNAAFIISGLLIVVGVVALFQSLPELSSRARLACTVLWSLPGFGSIVDGLFTLEHFVVHFLGFALALTTIVTFPITGWLVRRIQAWRTLGTALMIGGPLTLALAILYFATFAPTVQGVQTGIAGLTERLLIVEMLAWYVALGWHAFRWPTQIKLLAYI